MTIIHFRSEIWGETSAHTRENSIKKLAEDSGTMTDKKAIGKAEKLLGDEEASVTVNHNRSIGLKYAMGKAGASCSVTLTCNQDNKTIRKAQKIASELALGRVWKDMTIATEWIEELAEELKEHG